MKKQEFMLRQACERIAREDTEALEQALSARRFDVTPEEAEALYHKNQKKTLAQIAALTRRKRRKAAFLRAAACIALLLSVGWRFLSHTPPEHTPAAPMYSASVVPYASPASAPTEASPAATVTPMPTPANASTVFPQNTTNVVVVANTATVFPTQTPNIIDISHPSPTEDEVPIQIPESTVTPQPTLSPAPQQPSSAPAGWTGSHYPAYLPAGWDAKEAEAYAGCAVIAFDGGTAGRLTLTEYFESRLEPLSAQDGLACRYVALNDHVALLVSGADGEDSLSLIWEQDGCTLRLDGNRAQEAEIIAVARSTEKISAP